MTPREHTSTLPLGKGGDSSAPQRGSVTSWTGGAESETDYARLIDEAVRVYDVAVRTPLDFAPVLSQRVRNQVWLKREDLQPVFSFKLRGAYNFMAHLTREDLDRGVVASSAGNHAQGVALSARLLKAHATIVVPRTTPVIKTEAIRALGADLVLHGDAYDDAYRHAVELSERHGLLFVHPYDHPQVIAGQGTIGIEIDEQHPDDIAAVFVPVGGGGLIAGVALALKHRRPGVKVIGVEPQDADAMHRSLLAGHRITLDRVGLLADGVAVKTVGEETFRICRELVDEMVTVSNDEICGAIKEVFEDRRAILEPAGALAFAGLKRWAVGRHGLNLVAIASGANLNFDRLRYISERAQVGVHREGIIAVTIPERPGSFRLLCAALGDRNVTEFNYRMGDTERATVFAGVDVHGDDELRDIVAVLQETDGFDAADLTGNEVAKTHLRHMVGGRCGHAEHERVFHFDFPERPGALSAFLNRMEPAWNISLFHYRNHGSDRGRVLAGIQVPPETAPAFDRFLGELGYDWTEETDNPALRLFV